MKVFHHNDQDGRCSGFLVGHFMKEHFPETEVSFIEVDYDKPFSSEMVEANEMVFIVDFSPELEGMEELLDITEDVHWVDHHGTSIRKYVQWAGKEIQGIRSEAEAGCVLTYWYCTKFFEGVKRGYVPVFVRLIGDRDIWRWAYGERTRMFHRGLLAEDTSPGSSTWYRAWRSPRQFEKQGVIVERSCLQHAKEVFKRGGFWVEFFGHKCFAVNSTLQSSEYFKQLVPDADMWLSFRYTGECWSISLYSLKVDVSKIAENFFWNGRRGGGHKGAAGFTCFFPPFLPLAKEIAKVRLQKEVDNL